MLGAFHGVLSTQSLEHTGYPFGSVVPYAIGQDGLPLLLLSHLSQHTKNIEADPRCGLTVMQAGDGDVQQLARLSAVGDVRAIEAGPAEGRYFDYFPQTRPYFEQLGFRFYRFEPRRFHWNGGFATARWFSVDRLVRENPITLERQREIAAHMNADHRDALGHYLDHHLGHPGDTGGEVALLGIDEDGMDLRQGARIVRVPLSRRIASAEEVRDVLVEMAQR